MIFEINSISNFEESIFILNANFEKRINNFFFLWHNHLKKSNWPTPSRVLYSVIEVMKKHFIKSQEWRCEIFINVIPIFFINIFFLLRGYIHSLMCRT